MELRPCSQKRDRHDLHNNNHIHLSDHPLEKEMQQTKQKKIKMLELQIMGKEQNQVLQQIRAPQQILQIIIQQP